MTEKTEEQLTRDIFTHIRQILERDGDKAEILFKAIQLRKLLACEPTLILMNERTADLPHANWPAHDQPGPVDLGGFNCAGEYRWPKKD